MELRLIDLGILSHYDLHYHHKYFNLNYLSMRCKKSKNELFDWLNAISKSEYRSLQQCADGVGYLQVLDAIHGDVPIKRLNLNSKIPEDNLRNLRILEEVLRKIGVKQKFVFQKMADRKASQNLYFLQWLYSYGTQYPQQQLLEYDGCEKRIKILQKLGKSSKDMCPHLRSFTNQYRYYTQSGQDQEEQEDEPMEDVEQEPQEEPADQYTRQLQADLKKQMELNWKLMSNVDNIVDQRNSLYELLTKIYQDVHKMQNSALKDELQKILTDTPKQFRCQ